MVVWGWSLRGCFLVGLSWDGRWSLNGMYLGGKGANWGDLAIYSRENLLGSLRHHQRLDHPVLRGCSPIINCFVKFVFF